MSHGSGDRGASRWKIANYKFYGQNARLLCCCPHILSTFSPLSPFPPLTVDCNFQDNTATAKKMYKHWFQCGEFTSNCMPIRKSRQHVCPTTTATQPQGESTGRKQDETGLRGQGPRGKGLAKWVKKRGLPVDYCNKRNSANISSQSAVKRTQGGCAIFLCAPARIHRKAISI